MRYRFSITIDIQAGDIKEASDSLHELLDSELNLDYAVDCWSYDSGVEVING